MNRCATTLVCAMSLGGAAPAQTAERTQSCEAIIDAPVERVWAALTTEAGIEAWMVPVTSIDLRIGGQWRTSYNPSSNLHDDDTIIHTILAYEPMRMIALKTTPPPSAGDLFGGVDFSRLWGVYRLEPVDAGSTRITVTGLGYGQGEAWDRVYRFFEANNPLVLNELARYLEGQTDSGSPSTPGTDGKRVMALLHRWVGGEWIHEATMPDGGVFRVRNVITRGPDGVSLLCQGWLGDQAGMTPHSLAIIRRTVDGGVTMENVNESGDIARGRITLADDNTLAWDWSVLRLDGSTSRFAITTSFGPDPDTYSMTIGQVAIDASGTEGVTPMVEAEFRRVERAPEEFLRIAPQPAHSSGAAGG